jgi:hypothetical protein
LRQLLAITLGKGFPFRGFPGFYVIPKGEA